MAEVDNWSCFAVVPVVVSGGENKVLLVQDKPVSGRKLLWKLPGGRKEDFEDDPLETIRRELPEELGDKVTLNVRERVFRERVEDKPDKPHIFYGFVAEPISEEEADKVEMGGELCNVELFTISDIEEMIAYTQAFPLEQGMLPRHAKTLESFIQDNNLLWEPLWREAS